MNEAVTKRLKGLGSSGPTLVLTVPSVATLLGVWFLSNWLYSRDIWILGAICRVFCWAVGLGLLIMLVTVVGIVVYSLIKGDLD
jgi:hypothetical protein